MKAQTIFAGAVFTVASLFCGWAAAQDFDREPINYESATPDNLISQLQKKIDAGQKKLPFSGHFGYLSAVLQELDVPVSSQMLVYSKTSLQRHRITPRTPRALYFNDAVSVGFCQDGDVLEIAAVDSQLGTVFYTLNQDEVEQPHFRRHTDNCLICHASSQTQQIPGHTLRSVFTDDDGQPVLSLGTTRVNQTTPLQKRWGGWYVTGTHGTQTHLGNLIVNARDNREPIDNAAGQNVTDLKKRIEIDRFLTGHSDIVALLVLEHQAEALNLLTRASFQTREALHHEAQLNKQLGEPADHRWESTTSRLKSVAEPLVKYFLFSQEAPLTGKVVGTSLFAVEFPQRGPRDSQGRSLRDLDLERRTFKYPCSYLIYSPVFDALPDEIRNDLLRRLWNVLSGADQSADFAHLSPCDREAILEILRETKANLPDYWKATTR